MKKFILMPLLFFKISTCMKLPNFNLSSMFGATSSNNQPKRSHSLRSKEKDFRIAPKPKIRTNTNLSKKSFTDSFKKIVPPRMKYVTHREMKREIYKVQDYEQNERIKIRIQDAIVSVALFTLSKIDYSWIFQTAKNFFNSNAELNEA